MTRKKDSGSIVYLGPPISGIKTGTVYTAGLPEVLEKLKAQCPAAGILCVPMRRYAEVFGKLSVPNSAQAIAYKKTADYIREGVK